MARNPKFALSVAQQERADAARRNLSPIVENHGKVNVAFVKRDGEPRILSGTPVEIAGEDSAEHVKVMTDDGIRSVNLWSIKMVSI